MLPKVAAPCTAPISLPNRKVPITMDLLKPGAIWAGMSSVVHHPIDTKEVEMRSIASIQARVITNDTRETITVNDS